MVMGFVEGLGLWSWFVLAAVLLAVEIAAPGTFILWLGIAAAAVGVLSMFVDWGWQAQALAFGAFSLLAVFGWRQVSRQARTGDDDAERPVLNRRADSQIGREFTLAEPIVAGFGRVRIDDTVWRIAGPDRAAGTRVRVERTDGALLVVTPID